MTLGTIIKSPMALLLSGGVSGESGYPYVNTEARTLVRAMSVPPTSARVALIDALVGSLKSAGVFTKLDIFYVLAAHDAQAARLNWISPATFAAAEVSAPTFTTDRGYAGNGSSSYLNTTYVPSTNGVNLTQNSTTIGVWSRTAAAQASNVFGNGSGAGALVIGPRVTGDTFNYRVNQAATTSTASVDGVGHFAASRSGAGATQGYKSGATAGGAGAVASAALAAVALNIGRAAGAFTSSEIAAAYAGGNLTAGEHANLHTALATYMTAVGA